MGRYWQPCIDAEDCQVEDVKMECVKKTGLPTQHWCDCVNGWDLREGWCVNRRFRRMFMSR